MILPRNRSKIFKIILLLIFVLILQLIQCLFFHFGDYSLNANLLFGLVRFNFWSTGLFFLAIGIIFILSLKNKFPLESLLIGSGIISNLIDRLLRGGVVDYIAILFIPTFNLADLLIVVGTIVLVLRFIPLRQKSL